MASAMPVPEGGSEFDLWAVLTPTPSILNNWSTEDVWTHIGNKVVTGYLPQGTLKITTTDSYNQAEGIRRTRVDEPFTLTTTIAGLQPNDEDAPPAAKKVIFDHRVSLTPLTETVLLPDPTQTPELASQGDIITNGSEPEVYLGRIPSDDIYTTSAIETFSVVALADGETASLVLSTAQIEIWPLTSATFNNINQAGVYSAMPDFTIDLTNVYPDSDTFLQLYSGPYVEGMTGTKLNGGLVHRDSKTSNATLAFNMLESSLPNQGTYTIEVITVTPFGTDAVRGGHLTFDYRNGLTVRAGIHSIN